MIQVLEHSLLPNSSKPVLECMAMAIKIAPPNSAVQTRALVAKAVLSDEGRAKLVHEAYLALPKPYWSRSSSDSDGPLSPQPLNVVPTTPVSMDVFAALILAKCLALVEKDKSQLSAEAQEVAVQVMLRYRPSDHGFSILSFVAAYRVLNHFIDDATLSNDVHLILERMANTMRIWIGKDSNSKAASIDNAIRLKVVERCLSVSRLLAGVDSRSIDDGDKSDAGYGSLEDDSEKS
jgi:hypothetical protein